MSITSYQTGKAKWQAKNLPDQDLLRLIVDLGGLAVLWDLEARLPKAPPKVIRRKLASLIKRQLIEGCTCGCRGDFALLDAGRQLLDRANTAN